MVPWSGYFEDVSSSSPFVTFPGRPGLGFTRCFRSGDVGRWAVAQNGRETLQILGRCNQMVKVRFFWIWLGGLENLEFTATKNDEKRGVDGVYLGLRKMVLYKPLLYIYIYTHAIMGYIMDIYICHHYISHYGFTSAPKVRGQRVELSLVELALTSLRSGDLRLSESDRWGTVPRNGDRPHKVSLKYGEHIFYDGIMMGL